MSEAEQPVTINKSQVVRYLGKVSKHNMAKIDETLRISLHLEPEDPLPVPEFPEFP